MSLLKLGDRFLNTALVTEYTVEDNGVIVHFGPHHEARFTRHDATLLRRWLEQTAVDIARAEPESDTTAPATAPEPRPWRDTLRDPHRTPRR